MKDDIKRAAQFLFDNAEFISQELAITENYRNVEFKLCHFKHGGGTKRVQLSLYDETTTCYTLEGPHITIEEFRQLCHKMNLDAEAVPLPEQVAIRDSLE